MKSSDIRHFVTRFFYKQQFHKQLQAENGKKIRRYPEAELLFEIEPLFPFTFLFKFSDY